MKIIQYKSLVVFSDGAVKLCFVNGSNQPQVLFSEKDHKNFSINKKVKAYSKVKSNYLKDLRNKYI